MTFRNDPRTHNLSSPPGQEGAGVVDHGTQKAARQQGARHTNLPALKTIRQDLRNHATPAERALWNVLKGRQLQGRKFRRQHSVGRYVLDFYCPAERLAVEVDGGVHDDPHRRAYDAERQAELERLGIRVVRFDNREVLETPDLVAEGIAMHFGPSR